MTADPNASPRISVVIPVRNGAETLRPQLDAVLAQSAQVPFEIIVVDNGSRDGTAELVKEIAQASAGLHLQTEPVPGLNRARNNGVRAARGELIALCDSDDVVAEGWLEALWQASHRCALLGGNLELRRLNDDRTLELWGLGSWLSPSGPVYDFLPSPYGANCAFRRLVWDAVGGFDEEFVYGAEEVEFFWRVQMAGHRYEFVPDAVVHYRMRSSLRHVWRRQYLFGKANAKVFKKFGTFGVSRSSTRLAIKTWIWLMATAPVTVASRSARGRWVRTAAKRTGRLIGSLQERTYFP